jgi:hypothetical protein
VSYFFCANAAPEVKVMTAVAVTSAAVRSVLSKSNSVSLVQLTVFSSF